MSCPNKGRWISIAKKSSKIAKNGPRLMPRAETVTKIAEMAVLLTFVTVSAMNRTFKPHGAPNPVKNRPIIAIANELKLNAFAYKRLPRVKQIPEQIKGSLKDLFDQYEYTNADIKPAHGVIPISRPDKASLPPSA